MMDLAQQSRPSLWRSLLWKDFQQVKPTFLAVLVGVLGVQLILLFSASVAQSENARSALFGSTVTFACVGPVLLALGCSGMLIGHERQTGTWAWSSSLPVTWRQALGSKLLVSTIGSLCASLPLAIIPVLLVITRLLPLPSSANVSLATFYISSMTIVIFFEVILFCFLATVLLRETLTALVVAGIGLVIVQIFIGTWFVVEATPTFRRWGANGEEAGPIAYAIFVSGILLVGSLSMVAAFRWRWGIGQQATLTFWRTSSLTSLPMRVKYPFAIGSTPSERWMMLRHSWANSFWLRMLVFVGAFLLAIAVINSQIPPMVVAIIAAGAFGVTVFEGDQTLSRFRFLADRGVNPRKLVISRLCVVMILALPVSLIAGLGDSLAVGLWLSPIAFLTGALSSMCFRKPVIAVTVAIIVSFVSFVFTSFIVQLVTSDAVGINGQRISGFDPIVLSCTPVVSIALLVAIFGLSRRWLIFDDPKLELHFLWISMTALVSPVFIACTFGFLLVPSTQSQAEPSLTKIEPEAQADDGSKDVKPFAESEPVRNNTIEVPDLLSLDELLLTDKLPRMSILSSTRGLGMQGVADSARDAVSWVKIGLETNRKSPDDKLMEVLRLLIPKLEATLSGPRKRYYDSKRFVEQLENLIARTAALATVALQSKDNDMEFGLRLWRLNRELQEIARQLFPLQTHASRNVAMQLLLELRDEDVDAIGGPDVFRSLIPSLSLERTATLQETRDNATLRFDRLRDNAERYFVQYYPPLRWYFERQIAFETEGHLISVQKLQEDYLTGTLRASLLARYPK
ncbi:MAG TPA: hypothetical protein VM260_08870 [Pirellula sp.]|nr:hypothetical protein [Pirellula sp.]